MFYRELSRIWRIMNNHEMIEKYSRLDSIRMKRHILVMANMVTGKSTPSETEEEIFDRVQKEFVCSIIELAIALELIRNGLTEYQSKLDQHFKEVYGNIQYKFPKGDLYYAALAILGTDLEIWEDYFRDYKPGFFKRFRDPENFEFWFRTWINLCCEIEEYTFARYLATNVYNMSQQVKGLNVGFIEDLSDFIG